MPDRTAAPPIETQHLDLQFTRTDDGRYRVRVLDSPAGSGAHDVFALPFDGVELAALRALEPMTPVQVRGMGEQLYMAVFGGEVRQILLSTLHMLGAQGTGQPAALLQIRLWLSETPELASLPWELLYLSEFGLHLALMPQVSLIRHLDVRRRSALSPAPPPLNILCVIAAPSDIDSLNTEREWQRLQTDFTRLVEAGLVRVQRLPQATFAALAERLDTEAVHVLHFVGHGVFDPANGDGAFVFEDPKGMAQLVSGDQLAQVLGAHPSLRLVVLNTCEGAQTIGEDAHVGVAQRLVVGGLPAVVAMQFRITDDAARIFSQEFYESLSRGRVVDVAMQRARQAIYAQPNPVEWTTPVLFEAKGDPLRVAMPPASLPPAAPPTATGDGSTGRSKAPWLIAALAALSMIIVVGLFANERFRCALRLATCDNPGATAEVTPAPTTDVPTLEAVTATTVATPVIAGRPPITVGFASLLDCTEPDLRDVIQTGIGEELRSVDLLDTRVFIEPIDDAITDDAAARRYKGRYDIMLWGGCEPATETVEERVTVTATLILVGDSLEEAVSHRSAQPDVIPLELPASAVTLTTQGISAIIAYYGEYQITHSLPMLELFSVRAEPYFQNDQYQRVLFNWLKGNAALEHPKLLFSYFPERDPNHELFSASLTSYDHALELLEQSLPAQSKIYAAIKQNQGWLHMRTGEYSLAIGKFEESMSSGFDLVGAVEGYAYANLALGAEPSVIDGLCEKLIEIGGGAQGTSCIATNAWYDKDHKKAVSRAMYATDKWPDYATSYIILAWNACDIDQEETEAISLGRKFLSLSEEMSRWDIVGSERLVESTIVELDRLLQDGDGCPG